ncbi:unnamed protein product [Bursaphelenchus xylophilus]|uniref:(pine wood nematode) hypothetical protein n=1 Tax=Bursaphelenchus xylophilus TaxID=6326 RepID=A0A1I7SQI7_BURXY|nr:unnamed protein product [Bursaphelenchus xylophilus]CAG9109954.1 unnamed protein product [Bursaphelenchus xylophilus]
MWFKLALLVAILLNIHPYESASSAARPRLGEFEKIDVNDKEVQRLARKAVHIYNKQAHRHLIFTKVTSAERQSVNGYNYNISLQATRGSFFPLIVSLNDFAYVGRNKETHNVTLVGIIS